MVVRRGQDRPTRRTGIVAALAVVGLAVVGLAACGGDDGGATQVASLDDGSGVGDESDGGDGAAGTGDAPADPEEAMLAFAECMREHGVDMADPEAGGAVMAFSLDDDVDLETMDAANEACAPLLANSTRNIEIDPEREAEMREEMLAFSECMREHGVDMPDPTFDGDGSASIQVEVVDDDGSSPVERDTAAFEAAAEECGGGMVVGRRAGGDD